MSIPARSIATVLVALMAVPQLLLWSFLGFAPLAIFAGAIACGGFCVAFHPFSRSIRDVAVDLRLVGLCFAVSLLVFALGGEGRFFYANTDWQVRNAVLHDLATYPWPFAYAVNGEVDVLRAPLGLYLLPALVGKIGGLRAAEIAMLVQSAAMLTCIMSLGATLFDTKRERIATLIVFLAFSGMDILGMASIGGHFGWHLEGWGPLQYSSHVTQAFWVPMHALAGWTGAILYLLWRTDRISLAGFLAPLPLMALLSPLALIGVIPFAAQAGIKSLWTRSLRLADFGLPLASVALALPSLVYLASGSGAVGGQATKLTFDQWALFEAIEVAPYVLAALVVRRSTRFGSVVPLLASAILLVLPFGQVGSSGDLTMRASIPALAILSVLVAEFLLREAPNMGWRILRAVVVATLLVGSLTPLTEIMHALTRPRPAMSTCSYFGVVPKGAPTYETSVARLPRLIAPSSRALVHPKDPLNCKELTWFEVEERYEGPLLGKSRN